MQVFLLWAIGCRRVARSCMPCLGLLMSRAGSKARVLQGRCCCLMQDPVAHPVPRELLSSFFLAAAPGASPSLISVPSWSHHCPYCSAWKMGEVQASPQPACKASVNKVKTVEEMTSKTLSAQVIKALQKHCDVDKPSCAYQKSHWICKTPTCHPRQ